ncbi:MAG: transcriptional regulator [Sphingobacteriaceae bacterium]|nr:transcriptional regulator [Sphingobacteriaceae bacterium]
MNYITHLNKAFAIFCEDERLSPFHVSLYFSLFQYWNMAKFRNPISISRDELMRASKIGSVNTYIRCIKELDKWAYIKYIPSYNPQKGSQVYLYNFNNSNNNGSDISNTKGADKTAAKATDKASEKPVIPSINNSNSLNNTNSLNEGTHSQNNNSNIFSDENSKNNPSSRIEKKEKSSAKKEMPEAFADTNKKQRTSRQKSSKPSPSGREREGLPLLEEVQIYFTQNNYPIIEAEKFHNHYESNGWLVGGKTPMKNWKASANNWMLNSRKFNDGKTNSGNTKKGNLHTSTNKNYGEPL